MAREDFAERGLPSAEVRQQILQRAGLILNEARNLVAQLDRDEACFPRSVGDPETGERLRLEHYRILPPTSRCAYPDRSLAA
jgi:hypothetical protein